MVFGFGGFVLGVLGLGSVRLGSKSQASGVQEGLSRGVRDLGSLLGPCIRTQGLFLGSRECRFLPLRFPVWGV